MRLRLAIRLRYGLRIALAALLVSATGVTACGPDTPERRLRRALGGRELEAVRKQLEATGFGATHVFEDGRTTLHVVAQAVGGRAATMRYLIERGADPTAQDKRGSTPWDVLLRDGRSATGERGLMVEVLLEGGFVPPPLAHERGATWMHELADRCDNPGALRRLRDALGLPVDALDDYGWTPLHYAAFHGNEMTAKGLVEDGVDVNAETTKDLIRLGHNEDMSSYHAERYERGSRPLDVARPVARRRRVSVTKVIEGAGGTRNPSVDNKLKRR